MNKKRLLNYLENCKLTKNHVVEQELDSNGFVTLITLSVLYGARLQHKLVLEKWSNTGLDNFERVK